MPHEIGRSFYLFEIAKYYQADKSKIPDYPHFLLHRGDDIVALTLRRAHTQFISADFAQTWLTSGGQLAKWCDRLVALKGTKNTLPLYFKPADEEAYIFYGQFKVYDVKDSPNDIKLAITCGAPKALASIVFLERVRVSRSLP